MKLEFGEKAQHGHT